MCGGPASGAWWLVRGATEGLVVRAGQAAGEHSTNYNTSYEQPFQSIQINRETEFIVISFKYSNESSSTDV